METIDLIKSQISTLNNNELKDLMFFIQNIEKKYSKSIIENLKNIKIDAPADFASNIDNYLYSGEKH